MKHSALLYFRKYQSEMNIKPTISYIDIDLPISVYMQQIFNITTIAKALNYLLSVSIKGKDIIESD